MNFNENDIDLFDGYLADSLSTEQKEAFESRLEKDSTFRESFEEYQILNEGLKFHGLQALKNDIASWESNARSTQKVKPIWYAAAAVLFIGSVWLTYTLFNRGSNSEELFASYYKPYPDVITARGNDEDNWNEALRSYNQQNYELAVEKFNKLNPNKK